jgi:hypothetical protein
MGEFMMNLFDKYLNEGLYEYAHIVIKNEFYKDISNKLNIEKYITFLMNRVSKENDYETNITYIQEAETVLSYWVENVSLNDDTMNMYSTFKIKIHSVFEEVKEFDIINQDKLYQKKEQKIKKDNTDLLAKLSQRRSDLIYTKSEDEFEKILIDVKKLEEGLIPEFFTESQQRDYENLTRGFTQDISTKASYFDSNKVKEYNNKAVHDFDYVFQKFIKDEDKYVRDISLLKGLLDSWFFKYDAAKLNSEVIVFYNYIYSYIFNKLDNKGKFEITKISITSSKN